MATLIRFGNFRFVSTTKKYMPISDYSTSASYEVEENEQIGSKPTTSSKGPGLRPLSFKVYLTDRLGVSAESVKNKLMSMCEAGVPKRLYRNGKLERKNKFLLLKVEVEGEEFSRKQKMLSCTLKLNFQEVEGDITPKEEKSDNKR